ncbi:hypothetical protein HanPI659440_Chr16g0620691 [Helianthus annuus]|nr:hypothetical protein HanPI659440_Chr16g0620691 [Helianthus annuus]
MDLKTNHIRKSNHRDQIGDLVKSGSVNDTDRFIGNHGEIILP